LQRLCPDRGLAQFLFQMPAFSMQVLGSHGASARHRQINVCVARRREGRAHCESVATPRRRPPDAAVRFPEHYDAAVRFPGHYKVQGSPRHDRRPSCPLKKEHAREHAYGAATTVCSGPTSRAALLETLSTYDVQVLWRASLLSENVPTAATSREPLPCIAPLRRDGCFVRPEEVPRTMVESGGALACACALYGQWLVRPGRGWRRWTTATPARSAA
jgi:hypothetical protein